jgi:hypothetical protein
MSVLACSPHRGSEEGVGCHWALETARLGHRIIALTQTELRSEIEAELASGRLPPSLRFEFFMPPWLDRLQRQGAALGFEQLTWHLIHLLWQVLAYRHVRKHLAEWRVDLVHHVTFGGIRHPTLMGRLPIAMVLGPLGGGERAPFALRRGFGWRDWLIDAVRDLHTWLIRFDPITRWEAIADALEELARTDGLLPQLSAGALARAESMRWPRVVSSLYDDVGRRLRHQPALAASALVEQVQPRRL